MKPEDRLPCREAEIAQARYEKAEAERDNLRQELDLSVKLREAADARIVELEASIQFYCATRCPRRDSYLCPNGECPLYPYRRGE